MKTNPAEIQISLNKEQIDIIKYALLEKHEQLMREKYSKKYPNRTEEKIEIERQKTLELFSFLYDKEKELAVQIMGEIFKE